MTQIINHDLGYKIVHNPGYDYDLGYKNKSEYALEEQFLLCTTCKGNKFINLCYKRIQIYF